MALDLAATAFTLMTVLRENVLLVWITGRYDRIRGRLTTGTLSYDIVETDLVTKPTLPDLVEVGSSWRFFAAPTRTPDNLGEDRNLCRRMNTINASYMGIHYDDFWGKGVRREQFFLFSISAAKCQVLNVKPSWWETTCMHGEMPTNLSAYEACNKLLYNQFERLQRDADARLGVVKDPGEIGHAFLKCPGRPAEPFGFVTDLMVHQTYWAGGAVHAEFQTSQCMANPLYLGPDRGEVLFEVVASDQEAECVSAVDQSSWVFTAVSFAHSMVAMFMIFRGVIVAMVQSQDVRYVPYVVRFFGGRSWLKCRL